MADNLPIDIDFKKVNDWMFDRKKLPKDWVAKHKALGLKLADIFSKTPIEDAEIKKFMKDNEEISKNLEANYLTLTKVIDKLVLTEEGKNKNMFGRYTSKSVNELIALKKLYEKDNLHIADIAKIMSQNAAFEIPAIRKNITTFENQIQELIQEEQSYKNSIAHSEREFANYCEKLGIPGENIHKEVPALIKHLPEIFNNFVATAKAPIVREILDFYYSFTKYINPKQKEQALKLSLIEYLHTKGDDLLELYETVQKGKDVPHALHKENDRKYSRYLFDKQTLQESWQYFPQIVEISTNQVGQSTKGSSGGIDWGEFEVIGQSTNLDTSKKNAEDLGFEIIDDKQQHRHEETEVVTKDTLLSNFETRNAIIANLNELLYFLQHRLSESGANAGNTILQAYEQVEHQGIFEVSKDKLNTMISHINSLIEILSSYKARQYFILKEQPKASERIIANLNQFKINANKARDNFGGLSKRNYDITKAIKENKDSLDELIKQTAECKVFVEAEMKKLIKRDVVIIGDIHKMLSNK